MKWIKDERSVEISQGLDSETNKPIWDIECTGIKREELPPKTRDLVFVSDAEGYERLVNALSSWAEREGFKLVQDTTA